MITQANVVRTSIASAPRGAAASLDEAITQAQTGALQLQTAHQSTKDAFVALDGYQPAATDISRDTVYRDVSESARSIHRRTEVTTNAAQDAGGAQYSALSSLDWAIAALDQALQELPAQDRQQALQARQQLSQSDALWHADVALGNAQASMNGGALPYIESAEADGPGQDVSWTGGEIYGGLRETLGNLNEAGYINGRSLSSVNSALVTLRSLRDKHSGGS